MPLDRPNILFLMSDEHRADVTGYEGNTIIRTPNLDWLSATGIVCRNAYTPSPICIPGRQALMSGQLPSTNGCRVYGEDLPPGHMTFARRFAQYAYATVCCGKLHHMGPDQMQGWTKRIGNECQVNERYIEGRVEAEFERFRRPGPPPKWSDAKECQRAGIGRGPNVIKDEYSTWGALEYLDHHFACPHYDRELNHQPLLLKLSLNQPHYPYCTDEEKFTYYLNRVEPYLNETPSDHPFLSQRQVRPGSDCSERDIRRATAAYYGMIETIDGLYGAVLERLRHLGQDLDDWLIIYTSDHGEMLGQHGIWEKQKFYEASVRVPLLIRWPRGLAGGLTLDANVSLCDLFATLCELAGIPAPAGLDSRSFAPLLRGEECGWDNEVVSQFGRHNLMLKRGDLKYQWYGPELPEVLFDLATDPGETTNVVADPRYGEAVAAFRARASRLGYGPPAVS